jgi:hypothetical protein
MSADTLESRGEVLRRIADDETSRNTHLDGGVLRMIDLAEEKSCRLDAYDLRRRGPRS